MAHGISAADDVATRVGGIGLPDVGQSLGIAQDVDRLLHLGEILRTENDRRRLSVAGNHDAFMLVLDPIDDLGQVVSDIPQGLSRHGHNCGAFFGVCPAVKGPRRQRKPKVPWG